MNQQSLPFMSVVICLYNGADVIGRAIESLLEQDYPRDRYEIIVVEDGSRDDSFEVASRYPVQVVRHAQNSGLSAARRTGLDHVRGDIYVCFDDDCTVPPGWLREVAKAYQRPNVRGVGSVIVPPKHVRGLVDHFMVATGSGNPPSLKLGASKSLAKRFFAYLGNQVGGGESAGLTAPYAVRELYGASASFPVEVLRKVGGWDPALRWMEDIDICARVAQAYPDRSFYAVPTAHITHDPKMDLATFIKRPYSRGIANYLYYRRNRLTPPIFPFPLIWLAGIVAGTAVSPLWGLLAACLGPQLLYVWWPVQAARKRSLWSLTFCYLQLADELSTITGIVRGYAVFQMDARRRNS